MKNRYASEPDPEVHVITDLPGAKRPGADPEFTDTVPPEKTPDGRPLFWHAWGGAIQGKRAGRNNFAVFTAGPMTKSADAEIRKYTIPGTDGETFRYLGSFSHDPTDADLETLKPKDYR